MDKNYEASVDYSCFVIQLIHFFKECNIDPYEVQAIAHSFEGLKRACELPAVFNFEENSIGAVFSEITKQCSWFNYESLQNIVKNLGNDLDKEYLKTYENKHLIPYLHHSIYEIPCATCQGHSQCISHLLKVSADLFVTVYKVKAVQEH